MDNLIQKISINNGRFPRKELQEIINNKNDYIPELLQIARNVRDQHDKVLNDENYIMHLYSFFLLTQFKVKEFYPIFIDILKLPKEELDYLLGDFLTEDVNRVLTTFYQNEKDLILIKELIEDEKLVHPYVAGQAFTAMSKLALSGRLDRLKILDYFEEKLLQVLQNPDEANIQVVTQLVCSMADLYPEEKYGTIKQAFDMGIVDGWAISLENIEEDLEMDKEQALERALTYSKSLIIEDTIQEMNWWGCFYKDRKNDHRKKPKNMAKKLKKLLGDSSNQPTRINKIGRNEPCTCGSGKKYKKCCGK